MMEPNETTRDASSIALAVLETHYPDGTLLFWNGEFRRYGRYDRWYRVTRRALAPFIYKTLLAHGAPANTVAVREVSLALSAMVLATREPIEAPR